MLETRYWIEQTFHWPCAQLLHTEILNPQRASQSFFGIGKIQGYTIPPHHLKGNNPVLPTESPVYLETPKSKIPVKYRTGKITMLLEWINLLSKIATRGFTKQTC